MSRIGQAPISVPEGIDVKIDGTTVTVKGKAGELTRTFPVSMKIDLTDGVLSVTRPNDEPDQRALHGLTRSLINNMVIGCSDGFSKRLELIGTGYRVQQKGGGWKSMLVILTLLIFSRSELINLLLMVRRSLLSAVQVKKM